MSRVITFSRVFPSYHPRAGEPTYFIEKIIKSVGIGNYNVNMEAYNDVQPKHHTIRAGHRWKVGDKFSPRVWSGKPYNSKQIQFAPDIEVKKVWDFDITGTDWALDGRLEHALTGEGFDSAQIALNDGLTNYDPYDWLTLSPDFKKSEEFHGQIICWNENINY